jgi:nicotinamidase-related amidase
MSRVAVVVVDLQRDFLDEELQSPSARWAKAFCVAGVAQLLSFARSQGWQIIHIGTQHQSEASLPFLHRVRGDAPYCLEGTPGSEFVVSPEQGEICLYKTWYSAFDANLDEYVSAGDTIVWAGVSTDCCIQASAFDADRREIRSVIPIQAVSASSCRSFSASLTALGKSVASVVGMDALLAGENITDPAIEVADIGAAAEEWFKGQEARMGTPASDTGLGDVLKRLRTPTPTI